MKLSASVILSLAVLFFNRILSLPTGAPICSIDESRITSGHTKPSDETLDYEISVNEMSSNTFEISIMSKVETTFKGVLIYVTGQDPNSHVGSFTLPNDNFKFQSEICKSEGINGSPESTITHANPSDKALSEIKFNWSYSKEKGPFKVMAVIAKDRNPWKLVKEVTIDQAFVPPFESKSCASSVTSTRSSCSTTMIATSQPVYKMFKCTMVKKEWKEKY